MNKITWQKHYLGNSVVIFDTAHLNVKVTNAVDSDLLSSLNAEEVHNNISNCDLIVVIKLTYHHFLTYS